MNSNQNGTTRPPLPVARDPTLLAWLARVASIIQIPVVIFGGLWGLTSLAASIGGWRAHIDELAGSFITWRAQVDTKQQVFESWMASANSRRDDTLKIVASQLQPKFDEQAKQIAALQAQLDQATKLILDMQRKESVLYRDFAGFRCRISPKDCRQEPDWNDQP